MAMSKEDLKLRAQARKAGIEGYQEMSLAEIREALSDAKSGKAKPKRKSASAVSKRKSASAVTKPGRKPKRGRPARKSTDEDSDMSEKQAKRIVSKYAHKRGRRPAEFYEAQAVLGIEDDKPKAKPVSKRKSAGKSKVTKASQNGDAGRNLIDHDSIDWSAEWAGGLRGNRAKIMKALRKFRGDYDKVFNSLKDTAQKMYAKSQKTGKRYSKSEALAMLRWHIGRTAFDFVTGTEQHTKATNRKNASRASKRKSSTATTASDNGVDVSEMSDVKLRKIIKSFEGKRGRRSAEFYAAESELAKRAKGKTGSKPAGRQKAAGGRRKASRRKVKA